MDKGIEQKLIKKIMSKIELVKISGSFVLNASKDNPKFTYFEAQCASDYYRALIEMHTLIEVYIENFDDPKMSLIYSKFGRVLDMFDENMKKRYNQEN